MWTNLAKVTIYIFWGGVWSFSCTRFFLPPPNTIPGERKILPAPLLIPTQYTYHVMYGTYLFTCQETRILYRLIYLFRIFQPNVFLS